MSLKNKKNVVITGASGQVGLELVKILKSEFNIIPIIRSYPKDDLNIKYFSCRDLADKDESIMTFNKIVHEYQSIDCLINVAGGFDIGYPIEQQDWDKMFDVNFLTMLNATSYVLKYMKSNNGGKIINFGSVAGIDGMGMAAPYSASKAAVHNLSKTINLEAPSSISSHLLVLSIIDTKVNREAMPDSKFSTWTSIKSIAEKITLIINDHVTDQIIYFD
tara:strand:+ start:7980 stop:8636 length:657 start_codon:yes stop_codon:yes gene_type:complete